MGLKYFFAALVLAATAPAAAATGVTEGADPAIWDGKADSGAIVHRASHVAFPEEVEGFRRFRVAAVTPTDVVANYRLKDGETEMLASAFLFRPANLTEDRLKGSLAAFASHSPEAFVWAAGPFEVAGPPKLHGYKGMFKTGIGPESVLDYLYFFALGEWTVKIRTTGLRMKEPEQEARIDAFVRALPWSAILAANGACGGTACSAPAFENVDGHMMQGMLGPMLAAKMEFDARKEAALPVAARVGKVEVRRLADDDDTLYVATVKGRTYRLVRLPGLAKGMFTEVFGKLSFDKPLYGLVTRVGGKDSMPRLFHGEPTAEAFGEAVRSLAGKDPPGMFLSVAKAAQALPD